MSASPDWMYIFYMLQITTSFKAANMVRYWDISGAAKELTMLLANPTFNIACNC